MKQVQRQQLQQKFSPQQIQLMRLLQLPVTDLESAIKEEVEKNPLLEAEVQDEEPLPTGDNDRSDWDSDEDDFDYDYREQLERDPNDVRREFVLGDSQSPVERLMQQLSLRHLTERQMLIATELVGSLDDAGYLGRDLALITNDMAFRQGVEASQQEVEEVLRVVQSLEPAGIGARNLRECLLLQLQRLPADATTVTATAVVRDHFDDFANHRYERICEALDIDDEDFEAAADVIRHLNPKPAGSTDADTDTAAIVTPDIVLTQHDGQLGFYLNDSHLPQLSLSSYYVDMLHEMEQRKGDRETVAFLKSKQADAQGFIDLLQQRHDTIVRVMRYIVRHQRQFLLTGDPDKLQPLRQREVAEATGLDISTVSRMANSKYLQTDFGTIPLKECFSKGMATDDGVEVAVETVKQRLSEIIESEDKQAPLSDDALTKMLNAQGLPLARRTVAKYREQLGIPVARLRRALLILLLLAFAGKGQAQMSYYDSIIAVRLEKAAKDEKRLAAREERKAAKPEPAKKSAKPAKPVVATTTAAEKTHASAEALDAYIVPLWYDGFPSSRVNPHGRTMTALLPDEINLLLAKDSSDFCFPVRNMKTSPYGWRWKRGHHGVDIRLNTGDPVRAAFGGTVRVAGRMGGYGNCIVVRHPNGLETLYGHLSKIHVKHGQEVAAGEVIGLGGSTGRSTGPHLHFECRFLYQTFDPEWILDFENYSLRTRRLHLDKSYFGIRQPRKGEQLEYKADKSIIKESKKKRKTVTTDINLKDF
ncbi:MAG: RNA polymerase factor sigma-54 [Bacteroidales bacterium]|nr:RNA polymerase factor sigma-54 [Bacteroidales bacterium]